MKSIRGKEHNYLGQIMKFKKNVLEIDQTKYIEKMIKEFPIEMKKGNIVVTLAIEQMFKQDNGSKLEPRKVKLL